jgi:hypothetical protein
MSILLVVAGQKAQSAVVAPEAPALHVFFSDCV